MAQYIDKSVVVAGIEREKAYAQTLSDNAFNSSMRQFCSGMKEGCNNLLNFLNVLETKDVDLDLEKEIKNRIDDLSNLYCYMEDLFNGKEECVHPIPENVTNELFEFAKHFFELGLNYGKENE